MNQGSEGPPPEKPKPKPKGPPPEKPKPKPGPPKKKTRSRIASVQQNDTLASVNKGSKGTLAEKAEPTPQDQGLPQTSKPGQKSATVA